MFRQPVFADGPTGQQRPTGRCVLLIIITFGVYGYIYIYKVHEEMKRHSGRGIGGGIALLLSIIASITMPFITPAEVGALYARKGRPEPVRGWTGLWFLGPFLVGYLLAAVILLVIAPAKPTTGASGSTGASGLSAPFVVSFLLYFVISLCGAVTWFIKTNGALNQYWRWTSSAAT